jgi:hypothetical protein
MWIWLGTCMEKHRFVGRWVDLWLGRDLMDQSNLELAHIKLVVYHVWLDELAHLKLVVYHVWFDDFKAWIYNGSLCIYNICMKLLFLGLDLLVVYYWKPWRMDQTISIVSLWRGPCRGE